VGEREYVYEDWERAEVLPFVPQGISSLLDIGCSFGGFGAALKAARPDLEVFGIEPEARAAEIAATRLDGVMTGSFPEAMPNGKFDCIVFNDVLEHMSDPWSALEIAGSVVNDCGRVVASIPNVRHYTVLVPLLVKGRWTYHDVGILDRTHLRFFTRSTVRELFETTGWAVESITPTRLDEASTGEIARVLSFFGKCGIDFRARNFVVVARIVSRGGAE
jgi:2-polyprenyl-3-methyl-5-hydroxy-6-metoxy-1,4-benzoquinol methylase